MPRALITGAGGFVGPYLADHLRATGSQVWGTCLQAQEVAGTSITELDVRDAARVRAVVDEVAPDEIYHLAALSRPNLPDEAAYWDVNLHGTLNVLAAAREVGARVLLVGSAYVYGPQSHPAGEDLPLRPMNAYGASKAAAEMAAVAIAYRGTHAVRVRPFNHTGPGQPPAFFVPTLVQQLAAIQSGTAEPVLHLGDLTAIRDMSDVRDVVRAYPALLRQGENGEVYNVGRGVGTSMREIVDLALGLVDLSVDVVQDPQRLRPSDLPFLVADVERLHRTISWTPQQTLKQTLRDMLNAAEEAPGA